MNFIVVLNLYIPRQFNIFYMHLNVNCSSRFNENFFEDSCCVVCLPAPVSISFLANQTCFLEISNCLSVSHHPRLCTENQQILILVMSFVSLKTIACS